MDKLKAQLAPVLNQWFWIATALVLLGSVAIWWMASGTLTTQFESAKNKITTDQSAITSVSGKLNEHPNPKTHAEMDLLIKGREQEVLKAWTSIYNRQQSILVWPVAELKDDFVREFKDLTPIELKVAFPTPDDVEKQTSFLVRYRDYIGTVLPPIAAIAKTKWSADFDKSSSASMGTGAVGTTDGRPMQGFSDPNVIIDEGPLVVWPTESQEKLLSDLFPWRGGQPSTLEVLYSQENLWILRQLMQIVASVNGDVAQRFQAKIHEINTVAIGSSVKNTAGLLSKPEVDGTNMMMSATEYSTMSESGAMPSNMMGATVVKVDPGDNRYVDTAGKPVTASALRAALSSNSPTDAFMAVAKRIPVMLSLKMNQKAVPELLATCGSAQLMVEVKQVRILAAGASGATAGGGSTGYGSGTGTSGMSDAMLGPTGAPKNPFPLDMDVEIYGIIYIYNPPQAEKLGVEKVTENTVIEGTAMIDGRKVEEPAAVVPEAVMTPEALPPPSAATDAVAPAENNPIPPVEPAAPAPVAPPAGPEVAPPAAGVHWNRKEFTVRNMVV